MTPPTQSGSLRGWLADDLDRFAVAIWGLGNRLRPTYKGPLCPDCRLGPDLGEDAECPICREQWDAQQRDEAIYGSGYMDGQRDADEDADRV